MLHAILHLNYLAVIVVAVIGFALGGLWYSPLMFVKPWMKELKISEADRKAQGGMMAAAMVKGFLLTIVSTFVLATLMYLYRATVVVAAGGPVEIPLMTAVLSGAKMGFLVGVGLVAARQAVNAVFQKQSLKLFLIVAGHDVVLCVLQCAILSVWR